MLRKTDAQTNSLCYERQMHRLTVYATKEDIQAETFVYFKIVQTLVFLEFATIYDTIFTV